jgi:hypothetical protein
MGAGGLATVWGWAVASGDSSNCQTRNLPPSAVEDASAKMRHRMACVGWADVQVPRGRVAACRGRGGNS